FLPCQFANIGDRLVFSNGIGVLALLSIVLIVAFGGITDHLIPLYAVGVFLSFTLSQFGMVRRWLTRREEGWQRSAVINGVGGIATAVVLVVIAVTKFWAGEPFHLFGLQMRLGAWMVVLIIPLMVLAFARI